MLVVMTSGGVRTLMMIAEDGQYYTIHRIKRGVHPATPLGSTHMSQIRSRWMPQPLNSTLLIRNVSRLRQHCVVEHRCLLTGCRLYGNLSSRAQDSCCSSLYRNLGSRAQNSACRWNILPEGHGSLSQNCCGGRNILSERDSAIREASAATS
jgi:hypothetical protein